jgi:hypothetical protein
VNVRKITVLVLAAVAILLLMLAPPVNAASNGKDWERTHAAPALHR